MNLFSRFHSPRIVRPGLLVTDRQNPQNHFCNESASSASHFPAKIDKSLIEDLRSSDTSSKDSTFLHSLSSFMNQLLGKERQTIERLQADKGVQYSLLQAEDWLNTLASDEWVQDWLERKISRDKGKVWLITGMFTLSDAQVLMSNTNALEGKAKAAGALTGMPNPLESQDVGTSVGQHAAEGHARSFTVHGERVFKIQYTRVTLRRRKRDAADNGPQLASKPKWVPQWDLRGALMDEEEEEEETYESEEEDFFEAWFDDDSDDDALAKDAADQDLSTRFGLM